MIIKHASEQILCTVTCQNFSAMQKFLIVSELRRQRSDLFGLRVKLPLLLPV